MPVLRFSLFINAPIERVFDLARSVELHLDTTDGTDEEVVGGRRSGLMELDDEVTWEATHLWVRQRLTARITKFDRPHSFRDSMVQGAFHRFDHDHIFRKQNAGTVLEEVFDYEAPWSLLGNLAEWLFLDGYMYAFLFNRAFELKEIAETDRWKNYLEA